MKITFFYSPISAYTVITVVASLFKFGNLKETVII
jgi:hypothetical protein